MCCPFTMKILLKIFYTVFLIFIYCSAFSQVKISGIVVDSMSFKSLPGVTIQVKHKGYGVATDAEGRFQTSVQPFDTLLFSAVGYIPYEFPVLINEEDILIRMSEDVIYLQGIIVDGNAIRSPLIQEKKAFVYRQPKAAKLATGSGIAFDYFSKAQKERRKLEKLIVANDKVHNYAHIVSDPDFKEETMKRYKLTEEEYYELILKFNVTRAQSIEWQDEAAVLRTLKIYFCGQTGRCE